MAGYRPSAELRVVKPCGESWEAMEGGSRVRHCGSCDREVLNVAAMTPRELEAVIAKGRLGGPMPCVRMVMLKDGELLTATEVARPKWYQRVAAGVGAMVLSVVATAQQVKPAAQASLSGEVTDATGARVPGAGVSLRRDDGMLFVAKADRTGHFVVQAAPGSYELSVDASGFAHYAQKAMVLQAGEQALDRPVQIETAAVIGLMVTEREAPVEMPSSTSLLPYLPAPPLDSKTPVLQGRVVDPTGAPIEQAAVELTADSQVVASAETDKDGRFDLVAPPGRYVITASAKYFAKSNGASVELVKGARKLAGPIQLEVVATMGEVVMVNKPLKTRKVKNAKPAAAVRTANGGAATPGQR